MASVFGFDFGNNRNLNGIDLIRSCRIVEESSGFDPRKSRHRKAYIHSLSRLIKEEELEKHARRRLYPAMGAFIGEDFLHLLHQCLCFQPTLGLVRAVFEAYPEAIEIFCYGGSLGLALPLHFAVYFGASKDVVAFLVQRYKGALEEVTKDEKETPLHLAVRATQCDLDVLRFLVDAQPRALILCNSRCMTPIYLALDRKLNLEAILVLAKGNPDSLKIRCGPFWSPLKYACARAKYEVIRAMLGYVMHETDQVSEALCVACSHKRDAKIILMLVNANPAAVSCENTNNLQCPMGEACRFGYSRRVLSFLLEHYSSDKLELALPTRHGVIYLQRVAKMLSSNHATIRSFRIPWNAGWKFTASFLHGMVENTVATELEMSSLGWYVNEARRGRKEAGKAIQRMLTENSTLKQLSLSDVDAAEVTEGFIRGFSCNQGIEKLKVEGLVSLGDIIGIIPAKTSLHSLTVTARNEREADFPMTNFLGMIRATHPLRELNLSGIFLDSAILEVAEAIRTNTSARFEQLGFSRCISRHDLAGLVAAAVENLLACPSLRKLCISGNYLQNKEMVAIAECLKTNTSLRELDCSNNLFYDDAFQALIDMLQNHNCTLVWIESSPVHSTKLSRLLSFGAASNWARREQLRDPLLSKEDFLSMLEATDCDRYRKEQDSVIFDFLRKAPHVWV